ncbi:MAG TPA: pirin family protein [Saprospiraceae bacterium]|nr:pirin family protein [Saprospiraceae bacterium]
MRIISKSQQATGEFNRGQIIENKPIGFPQDGGFVRPYSSLFYWARAEALIDSTIGLHPHQGFEIMSFVLEGNIRHFDTKMNAWKPLSAGDVQIIRAGNGISHAEHLEKGGVIFQIWVDPDLGKTLGQNASYDDYKASDFKTETINGATISYYAGEKGLMKLDTPKIDIRRILIGSTPFSWTGDKDSIRSLYVIKGSGSINGKTVEQDDYIIIDDGAAIEFTAHEEGLDVFAFSTPVQPGYLTYANRYSH